MRRLPYTLLLVFLLHFVSLSLAGQSIDSSGITLVGFAETGLPGNAEMQLNKQALPGTNQYSQFAGGAGIELRHPESHFCAAFMISVGTITAHQYDTDEQLSGIPGVTMYTDRSIRLKYTGLVARVRFPFHFRSPRWTIGPVIEMGVLHSTAFSIEDKIAATSQELTGGFGTLLMPGFAGEYRLTPGISMGLSYGYRFFSCGHNNKSENTSVLFRSQLHLFQLHFNIAIR